MIGSKHVQYTHTNQSKPFFYMRVSVADTMCVMTHSPRKALFLHVVVQL